MFIYRIFKDGDENYYIGSCVDFVNRRYQHKTSCNNPNSKHHNYKIYQHIRQHGGWAAWDMEVLETAANRAREIELIKLNKPSLNTYYYDHDKKAWDKAYRENNKDSIKKYRENNKEKIALQQKEYYENNKVRIDAWDRAYRENNKERIALWKKEYRENNKEKIALHKNKKYDCECGGKYSRVSKARHFRSLIHQKYLRGDADDAVS